MASPYHAWNSSLQMAVEFFMARSDYKLGMDLKKRGYKATYLMTYLAVGEAPDEARNVFQQRSRWTKGHYQASEGDHAGISRVL